MSPSAPNPPLRHISPLVHASSWTFAVLNAAFLMPAFLLGASNELPLVGLLPSRLWGFLFFIHGVGFTYALIKNNWTVIKAFLSIGLVMESGFGWALIFTLPVNWESIGIVGVWLSLMVWQALCIIYFTPKVNNGDNR